MRHWTHRLTPQKLSKSHRSAGAIGADGGRNLIGRRTESDWVADGIRLDGGRERSDSVSKKMKQIAMFNRVLIGINE